MEKVLLMQICKGMMYVWLLLLTAFTVNAQKISLGNRPQEDIKAYLFSKKALEGDSSECATYTGRLVQRLVNNKVDSIWLQSNMPLNLKEALLNYYKEYPKTWSYHRWYRRKPILIIQYIIVSTGKLLDKCTDEYIADNQKGYLVLGAMSFSHQVFEKPTFKKRGYIVTPAGLILKTMYIDDNLML